MVLQKCDIMSQSGVLAMNEFTIRSVNRWELKVNLILLAVVFILAVIMGFLSKATSLLLFAVIYQTSYLLTIGWLIALLININGYNKKLRFKTAISKAKMDYLAAITLQFQMLSLFIHTANNYH